jgi:pimeloyl-ACP methyl ester carboxylesterase
MGMYFDPRRLSRWFTLLFVALVGAPALAAGNAKPPSGATWSYFFVGGHYTGKGAAQEMTGQMYVQRLEPAKVTQRYPIVMIHGTAQTGNSFMATPDGRPGWAYDFAERGYRVFVVDQVGRARSGTSTKAYGPYASPNLAFVQLTVGPRHSGLWPQVSLHTQWPGEAVPGETFFDQFMAQQVEYIASGVQTEELNLPANLALLEKIGPAIVLTHSQAGVFGWKLSDVRPDLVKAHIAIEPNGPPFFDVKFLGGKDWYAYSTAEVARASGVARLPLHFVPESNAPLEPQQEARADGPGLLPCWLQAEPARKLPNVAKVPSVIVTGEASYRATYDHCTVKFLIQAGVPVTHLRLEKQEIRGNGHMQMLEANSSEIAAAIQRWLVKSGIGS